jgi:hypothetical protein
MTDKIWYDKFNINSSSKIFSSSVADVDTGSAKCTFFSYDGPKLRMILQVLCKYSKWTAVSCSAKQSRMV